TSSGRIPGGAPRSLDRPSFTLIGSSYTWRIEKGVRQEDVAPRPGWARRRPATTLLGEPRVFGPGCWPRNGHPPSRGRRGTVRVREGLRPRLSVAGAGARPLRPDGQRGLSAGRRGGARGGDAAVARLTTNLRRKRRRIARRFPRRIGRRWGFPPTTADPAS